MIVICLDVQRLCKTDGNTFVKREGEMAEKMRFRCSNCKTAALAYFYKRIKELEST